MCIFRITYENPNPPFSFILPDCPAFKLGSLARVYKLSKGFIKDLLPPFFLQTSPWLL